MMTAFVLQNLYHSLSVCCVTAHIPFVNGHDAHHYVRMAADAAEVHTRNLFRFMASHLLHLLAIHC